MARIRIIAMAAVLAVLTGSQAQSADLVYSMSGGTITGTLNGVAFENASYSMTTTANPSGVQSHTVLGVVPSNYIVSSTMMTIAGFGSFTFLDALFGVASADINAVSAGNALVGFATQLGSNESTGLGPIGPGPYLSLSTPATFSGELITFTGLASPGTASWSTSAGTLNISATSGIATVNITPVPEPGTMLLATIAAAGVAWSARKRSARRPA